MNCVHFQSTCPNNCQIICCMQIALILGLWNFVQLKFLGIHALEMCSKFKCASHF